MVLSRNTQNLWSLEDALPQFINFFKQSVTTHVTSYPYFTLETFLAVLLCVLYALLYMDIGYIKRNTFKSDSIYSKIRESFSNTSHLISMSQTAYNKNRKRFQETSLSCINISPKASENDQFTLNDVGESQRRRFGEQLVRMSPKQFARFDRRRQLNKKISGKNMNSLSTLCDNVIYRRYSPKILKYQVEEARENLLCNKSSKSKFLDFQTDAVTDSIINLLQDVVTSSSLQKPLPFNGDIAKLALDASDLSIDSNEYAKEVNKLKIWEQNFADQEATLANCDMLSEVSSGTAI